jgi:hypothetical protein
VTRSGQEHQGRPEGNNTTQNDNANTVAQLKFDVCRDVQGADDQHAIKSRAGTCGLAIAAAQMAYAVAAHNALRYCYAAANTNSSSKRQCRQSAGGDSSSLSQQARPRAASLLEVAAYHNNQSRKCCRSAGGDSCSLPQQAKPQVLPLCGK